MRGDQPRCYPRLMDRNEYIAKERAARQATQQTVELSELAATVKELLATARGIYRGGPSRRRISAIQSLSMSGGSGFR